MPAYSIPHFNYRREARSFARLVMVLLVGLTVGLTVDAPAQTAVENVAPKSEVAVTLSPFEVSTSKDVGFVATSSLAGGRLAGELRDTPAAYSVLTREFIDALGLLNLTEASEWTVNSTNATTNGSEEIFGNTQQINSRGVSASAPQRNFFELAVNYDSYNIERFDYSRGPNSILFGSGTFGGAANVVTKVPRTDRQFGSTRASYGSWDNLRFAFDLNQPLSKTVALRLNTLWSDRSGWRDFEMERKKAITLAGLWKVFKNTEIRAEGETGHIEKNNPITSMQDRISGWDGVTTFSAPLLTVPSNSAALGIERIGSPTAPYFLFAPGLGMNSVGNFANAARTLGGGQSTGTLIGGRPIVGAGGNFSGNQLNEALNAPADRFRLAQSGSSFRFPKHSDALSTNTPTVKQDYSTYSTFIRQKVGENFYAEVAGNFARERRETQYINFRSLRDVYIDINRNLPDGRPNPHFLDAYSDGQRSRTFYKNEIRNLRVAAAYNLQNTRFGSYVFNTYGGLTQSENNTNITTLRVLRDSNPRNWPFSDTIFYRYYLNESDRPLPQIDTATFADPATGATTTYRTGWINDGARATDAAHTLSKQRYVQGAIKAALWKNRLHLLGAVRNDHLDLNRQINRNFGDYPANWDGHAIYFRPDAPRDFLDLTYVPKNAAGQPTGPAQLADIRPRDNSRNPLPQYANDRFQSDFTPPRTILSKTTYSTGGVFHLTRWLSVFGNYATSFNPTSGNLYLDGTFLPSAQSHGEDYGVRFNLLEGRVVVNIGRYSSFETPQSVELNGTQNTNLNAIANANAIGDFATDGRNMRSFDNVPSQTFDTRDRSNKGYEFELIANLLPNWRLSLNAALPDAHQSNAFANTRLFLAANEPVMRQILADAGVLINATNVASVDASIPTADRSPDASAAANAWNSLQNFKASLVTGKQKIVRLAESTANIFTDYRFVHGPVKNLGVGAGANYRGRQVIGYRGADTITNPASPTSAIDDPAVDAYTPVYLKGYTLFTATLSYRYKLAQRRELNFQFRVSNLLNEDTPIYYDTVQRPAGGDLTNPTRVATPNNFAYQTPRSFTFTTTLSF
ncbi:MAG: TonB-dependent receptor [Undibacterium sp.]|nr:TonB-dependent receptor [Opitutaceae bacterium]